MPPKKPSDISSSSEKPESHQETPAFTTDDFLQNFSGMRNWDDLKPAASATDHELHSSEADQATSPSLYPETGSDLFPPAQVTDLDLSDDRIEFTSEIETENNISSTDDSVETSASAMVAPTNEAEDISAFADRPDFISPLPITDAPESSDIEHQLDTISPEKQSIAISDLARDPDDSEEVAPSAYPEHVTEDMSNIVHALAENTPIDSEQNRSETDISTPEQIDRPEIDSSEISVSETGISEQNDALTALPLAADQHAEAPSPADIGIETEDPSDPAMNEDHLVYDASAHPVPENIDINVSAHVDVAEMSKTELPSNWQEGNKTLSDPFGQIIPTLSLSSLIARRQWILRLILLAASILAIYSLFLLIPGMISKYQEKTALDYQLPSPTEQRISLPGHQSKGGSPNHPLMPSFLRLTDPMPDYPKLDSPDAPPHLPALVPLGN